jgi:amino acid adenylation domain-containing protein
MTESFPLTPLQQAMAWNLRRAPHAGVDLEQWVVRLREAVDSAVLFKAWRQCVAAHGILRTRIDFEDPLELKQTVLGCVEGEFVTLDWRGLTEEAVAERFDEWLAVDRRRGFDPAAAPLWRIALVQTGPEDFRFVCTYHHVLLDGRSLLLVGRECFDRYDALRRGEQPIETHEPPFSAFVRRRRGFDPAAAPAYFRRTLGDDAPSVLPFAAEFRRSADEAPVSEIDRRLSTEATERLERFAAARELTPHALVQAAWAWTLAVHSDRDDHVFASVRACRKWPVTGIDNMVGMLINTVPFRASVDWDASLVDWLHLIRRQQVELRSYESAGLSEIARSLGRSSETPLCPTLLMFTDRPVETMLEVGGRPHSTREVSLHERSDFPLSLAVDWHRGARFRLEFAADVFTASQVESLVDGVFRFLEQLPDLADRPVSTVAALSEAERLVLAEASTAGVRPIERTVPEMVARQSAVRPAARAVVAEDRWWTYGELDRRASSAARLLAAAGVAPGDHVAVSLARSPELIAFVLGIWRMGAVYVPLDPKFPAQRLGQMLVDAAPRAVIVSDETRGKIAEASAGDPRASADYAFIDADLLSRSDLESGPAPATAASLDAPAVVLYTSGSTGLPKGVVLTHRGLANHHACVIRELNFGPHDRLAPVSSIGFDASLEEMFCTLSAGAEVHLPGPETLGSFERLLEFVRSHHLTILDLPTSLWRELTNYLFETHAVYPSSVRLIFMGGERATHASYQRFLKVGGDRIRWLNAYGPTETTIFSTYYEHEPRRDAASPAAPPIGRPIDNTQIYIVDRRGRPVPPGVVGELLIGGAGVARGYLNRPELTAERFVDSPSEFIPAGRYYRTGDGVRLRADGELEYVGRLDGQIKLRGFRIEPAEIESVLLRHPVVRDAAVTLKTSGAGTAMLVAYIVVHRGATFDRQALRQFAADNLPEYMVPTAWVDLDELPLSGHGKVDLRKLPEPIVTENPAPSREPTEFERRILLAWRAALGLEHIRLNDDFFAIGGDSLRAMALVARLESELGRRVPVNLLFHARTPERLAAELVSGDLDLAPLVLLRDGDRSRPMFFIHSLGGDVWIYCDLVRAMKSEAAIFGLQLSGLNRVGSTPETVRECAADYLRYVRQTQPHGPYRFAGYSSGGLLALEMAAQLRNEGEVVEFVGLIDTGLPPMVEQQRTFTRREKFRGLVANLPACRRELTQLGFRAACRRIGRFAAKQLRRLLPKSESADFELTDRELLECFAEDISMFPTYRLDLIRKHYLAVERYEPAPYEGGAHVFRSERQPLFTVQTPTLGWELVVEGKLSTHLVRGAHATLMHAPHVHELAAAIDAALAPLPAPGLTTSQNAFPGEGGRRPGEGEDRSVHSSLTA